MDPQFWRARWKEGAIGFHQAEINVHLQRFWPTLQLDPATPVFVPLCGKSLDLLWLRQQGHPVLGVELSAIAVEAFFQEHGLPAVQSRQGPFTRWECDQLVILCGDFFALVPEDVAELRCVYDRASLIALPPALRQRYMAHLEQLFPTPLPTLLVTLEYDQAQMDGPPFCVEEQELDRLCGSGRELSCLHAQSILDEQPRFRAKGLTALAEKVYYLR